MNRKRWWLEYGGQRFTVVELPKGLLLVSDADGVTMKIRSVGPMQSISFVGPDGGEAPAAAVDRLVLVASNGILSTVRFGNRAGGEPGKVKYGREE